MTGQPTQLPNQDTPVDPHALSPQHSQPFPAQHRCQPRRAASQAPPLAQHKMPQRKGSKPRGSKKGGGGGKFTWGKAGEVLEFEPLKKTDPAYDPYLVRR